MLTRMRSVQPDKAICIGQWASDEDFPVHPVGSQPKAVLIAPVAVGPALIPNHPYIFKTAKRKWQAQQLWSEVFAFHLGQLVGLDVPPSFAAINEFMGMAGVLMESFLHPQHDKTRRLVHAADVMTRILTDKKSGRPHNIKLNLWISGKMISDNSPHHLKSQSWWGRTLTFDALIGNSDRHPVNWGFLHEYSADGTSGATMAPVFDNGTSLGYERADDALAEFRDTKILRRYIAKGTHHCSWDLSGDEREPHIRMCQRFIEAYPDAGEAMRSVIHFNLEEVARILERFSQIELPVPFTRARADFVLALISERRLQLTAALGG